MASSSHNQRQPRQRQSIMDLSKFIGRKVLVKFIGGRESSGTLISFDPVLNLVLEDTVEYLREPGLPGTLSGNVRQLGTVFCRGRAVITICPMDGRRQIENPFLVPENLSD